MQHNDENTLESRHNLLIDKYRVLDRLRFDLESELYYIREDAEYIYKHYYHDVDELKRQFKAFCINHDIIDY